MFTFIIYRFLDDINGVPLMIIVIIYIVDVVILIGYIDPIDELSYMEID
jgi:hypothetical protein